MNVNAGEQIRGVMPIVPTPFSEDEEIDEASLRRLIDHYIDAGAHGLTLLGVMSEVFKVAARQRQGLIADLDLGLHPAQLIDIT